MRAPVPGPVLTDENGKQSVHIVLCKIPASLSRQAKLTEVKRLELQPGDYVTVTASRFPFATVMPAKRSLDWIGSISRTLNWNTRQKQTTLPQDKTHHL